MDLHRLIALRPILVLLTATVLIGSCASSAPLKQSDLEGLIEGMEKKAYIVNQFQAEFQKTRMVPVFDKEFKVNGKLTFQKPGRVRLVLSGDINVEILSDGRYVKIIHDEEDEEIHRVRGDRDMSKFADPLLLLIAGIGNGELRKLSLVQNARDDESMKLELDLRNENRFERIKSVFLWLSNHGEIKKVSIRFKDGSIDNTLFKSWAVLDTDGPEIRNLNERLKSISFKPRPGVPSDQSERTLPIARNDPFPEPFLLRKPVTADDFGTTDCFSTLTPP